MTTLAIVILCLGSLTYVLWPVFAPAAARHDAPPAASRRGAESLPLEQLEPPPGER